jgi:(S)-ureidoglycine---glyoxylate transaminase
VERLMPVADVNVPERLLAGGGPGSPDPRVLRAMASPLVGQFDPYFTGVMDDVMHLARLTLLTDNARCFGVSGLAAGGLEAVLNSLLEDGDRVAIGGGPRFVAETAASASRLGARIEPIDTVEPSVAPLEPSGAVEPSSARLEPSSAQLESAAEPRREARLWVLPHVDRQTGRQTDLRQAARAAHAHGALLVVDASLSLAGCELRVDEWGIDACAAGVDFALGAPSGMSLVTYSAAVEQRMLARQAPPRTSYLDLLQLQAYWSPQRLNHHTAPTSLIYGLREALRLVQHEGLSQRWARHQRVGLALRTGLAALGLDVDGDPPYAIVRWPADHDEASSRSALLEHFGVHVRLVAPATWCIGLLGADARLDAALRVLTALQEVLHRSGAVSAAVGAFQHG